MNQFHQKHFIFIICIYKFQATKDILKTREIDSFHAFNGLNFFKKHFLANCASFY